MVQEHAEVTYAGARKYFFLSPLFDRQVRRAERPTTSSERDRKFWSFREFKVDGHFEFLLFLSRSYAGGRMAGARALLMFVGNFSFNSRIGNDAGLAYVRIHK